jgi:hypothetical protein
MWITIALACVVLITAKGLQAATIDNHVRATIDDIPLNLREVLSNTQRIDIYNFGTEIIDQPIIVADKVVFNRSAIAQINNFEWPMVAIFADEFLFPHPESGAQIIRDLTATASVPTTPVKKPRSFNWILLSLI